MTGPELTAADICWTLAGPALWPLAQPVLDLSIEALPIVADDIGADLVEQLALALAKQRDDLRALRVVLSAALALGHTQHLEIRRLRHRVAALLDDRRAARSAA